MIQLNKDGTTQERSDILDTDVSAQWEAMKTDSSIDTFLTELQFQAHYKVWDDADKRWYYYWDRPMIYHQKLINS